MHKNTLMKTLLAMMIMAAMSNNLVQAADAKNEEAKELQLFSQAKISLIDAIKAAEAKTGGKAVEADLDDDSKSVQFEVEVVKDGNIHEVLVDGLTGQVIKVTLDDKAKEGPETEKE